MITTSQEIKRQHITSQPYESAASGLHSPSMAKHSPAGSKAEADVSYLRLMDANARIPTSSPHSRRAIQALQFNDASMGNHVQAGTTGEAGVSYLNSMHASHISTTTHQNCLEGEQSECCAVPDNYKSIVRRRVNGKALTGRHAARRVAGNDGHVCREKDARRAIRAVREPGPTLWQTNQKHS